MTTENSSVTGNGLVRHNAASAVPFVLAVRKPNRPLPTTSLCVPVAPANRRYLRELRNAEMRAWQSVRSGQRVAAVRQLVSNAEREQRDLCVFGLIVALTMTLAVVALTHSPSAMQQCARWVNVMRHALG